VTAQWIKAGREEIEPTREIIDKAMSDLLEHQEPENAPHPKENYG
jgi:hypothetical protein